MAAAARRICSPSSVAPSLYAALVSSSSVLASVWDLPTGPMVAESPAVCCACCTASNALPIAATCVFKSPIGLASASPCGAAASASSLAEKVLGGVGEGLQAVGGAGGAERDRVGAQRDRRGADVAGGALQGGGGARVGEGVGDFARPVAIGRRRPRPVRR